MFSHEIYRFISHKISQSTDWQYQHNMEYMILITTDQYKVLKTLIAVNFVYGTGKAT